MSDYDTFKYYEDISDREIYKMIGNLSDKQWKVFAEVIDKVGVMRTALFIARSYPIE